MHFRTDRTAHTRTFDGPVVDYWFERKITQTANAAAEQVRSDDPNLYRQVLSHLSYVSRHQEVDAQLNSFGPHVIKARLRFVRLIE